MTEGTIIALASGKGGVGKTTLAANMAATIASAGRRTVVIDADLGMANLADHLGVAGDVPTLHDVLAGQVDVDVATHDVGEYLFALPGSQDIDAYAAIDPDRLEMVVETVRQQFDYGLLDSGAGLSYDSAIPLRLADGIVIVTDQTPSSIADARRTVELAERIDGTVAGVIVNRTREDAVAGPSDIAARLGVRLLGTIPESPSVQSAQLESTPVIWHEPFDDASVAIRSIVGTLTGLDIPRPAPVEPQLSADDTDGVSGQEPTDPTTESSRGLLRRILGR